MNAIQFIRNYGIDEAREKIDDCDFLGAESFNWCGVDVDLIDLKRLVESIDLVNSLGGIKAARSEAHKDCFVYNQPLLAAIAAYESIYGGGDE
ncbi:hypothetical protein ACG9ZC_04145 [Acinetobacter baumannii]|uniref:hypothetical protein n=1 Tax=Acinetobacter baumannii TaxID=470 RepID=UPI003AF60791